MNLKKLFLPILALFCSGTYTVLAADAVRDSAALPGESSRGRILSFGIYQTSEGTKVKAPETQLGVVDSEVGVLDYKHIQRTREIPGKLGVSFGFEWTLVDPAAAKPIGFTHKLIHPPSTNPKTGKTITIESFTSKHTPNLRQFRYFTFEHDWEIVPGEWIFQVYLGSELVAEQRFTILGK